MLTIEWIGPMWLKAIAGGLLVLGSLGIGMFIYWLWTWEADWGPRGEDDE